MSTTDRHPHPHLVPYVERHRTAGAMLTLCWLLLVAVAAGVVVGQVLSHLVAAGLDALAGGPSAR